MNWRFECQTCAKAKRGYGLGVVFPCNEDKCEPEAIKITATTSSIPTKQYQSNKTVEDKKMKNKERYAKEIVETAIHGHHFAFDKHSKKVVACRYIKCVDCLFHGASRCSQKSLEWANAEYKEPKIFTEKEKEFIKLFPEIKYLARDMNGDLFAYTDKPQKDEGMWDYFGCNDRAATLKHITLWGLEFNSIKWEDEEPTTREEILREE